MDTATGHDHEANWVARAAGRIGYFAAQASGIAIVGQTVPRLVLSSGLSMQSQRYHLVLHGKLGVRYAVVLKATTCLQP